MNARNNYETDRHQTSLSLKAPYYHVEPGLNTCRLNKGVLGATQNFRRGTDCLCAIMFISRSRFISCHMVSDIGSHSLHLSRPQMKQLLQVVMSAVRSRHRASILTQHNVLLGTEMAIWFVVRKFTLTTRFYLSALLSSALHARLYKVTTDQAFPIEKWKPLP